MFFLKKLNQTVFNWDSLFKFEGQSGTVVSTSLKMRNLVFWESCYVGSLQPDSTWFCLSRVLTGWPRSKLDGSRAEKRAARASACGRFLKCVKLVYDDLYSFITTSHSHVFRLILDMSSLPR